MGQENWIQRTIKTLSTPDGGTRVVESIAGEHVLPDGSLERFESERIMCEGCGQKWVIPGNNLNSLDGNIYCEDCIGKAGWKKFFRQFWTPFYKP